MDLYGGVFQLNFMETLSLSMVFIAVEIRVYYGGSLAS